MKRKKKVLEQKSSNNFTLQERNSVDLNDPLLNDVVVYEDFPWQHAPENYALAITGKAFEHLLYY